MSFSPVIDNASANFIFSGLNRQTDANERRRLEQQQNLDTAAGTAMDYFAKAKQTGEELDMMNAKMGMFKDAGAIDGTTFDKYLGSSIGGKRAIAGMAESAYARNLKQQPPSVSAIPGTDYFAVNGNQVVPKSKPAASPKGTVRQTANGSMVIVDPTTGQASPVTMNGAPVVGQTKQSPGDFQAQMAEQEKAARIPALQTEIADLHSKIDSGNKFWGPDWLHMGSYEDALKQKMAEYQSLTGSEGAPGAQPAAPAAPAAPGTTATSTPAAPVGGIPEGTTATNPQTGQKVIYRNGAWQSN